MQLNLDHVKTITASGTTFSHRYRKKVIYTAFPKSKKSFCQQQSVLQQSNK